MKERSGMPYDVVAFETDENALALNEIEEGLFHRIMRKSWINGSVPADLRALAQLIRTRPSTLKKAWPHLSKMWIPVEGNPSRLENKKQESERAFKEKIRVQNSAAGKLSAKARETKENASTDVERTVNECSTSLPSPSLPLSNTLYTSSTVDLPPAEKRGRKPDPAAELFRSFYLEQRKNPYAWLAGDFEQLARLRKRLKIGTEETPTHWHVAIENYFETPLAEYSLKHLAAKFDTFSASPLDRYRIPTNHKNGNSQKENYAERTARFNREQQAEFDKQLLESTGNGNGNSAGKRPKNAILPGVD